MILLLILNKLFFSLFAKNVICYYNLQLPSIPQKLKKCSKCADQNKTKLNYKYPAFSTSSLMATKHVSFFPLRIFVEQNIQAP